MSELRVEAVEKNDARDMRAKYDEFNRTYGFRKINPLAIYSVAAALSMLWIGAIAYYVANSIYSTESLLKMLPHEFGGFLAGTIMPIGFVWMIALYIDRNMNSNYEQKVIYPFLQSIVDPAGDTSVIMEVIRKKLLLETEALKSAVTALSENGATLRSVSASIAASTADADKSMESYSGKLENLIETMAKAASDGERMITKLMSEGAGAEEKAKVISGNITAQLGLLNTTASDLSLVMEAILAGVDKSVGMIVSGVETAEGRSASIVTNIETGSARLLGAMEGARTRSAQILATIDENAMNFVTRANVSAEKISGVTRDISKSVEIALDATDKTRRASLEAMDKIEGYANFISERLLEHKNAFVSKSGDVAKAVSEAEAKVSAIPLHVKSTSEAIVAAFKEIEAAVARERESIAETSMTIASGAGKIAETMSEIAQAGERTISTVAIFDKNISEAVGAAGMAAKAIEETFADTNNGLAAQIDTARAAAGEIRGLLQDEIEELGQVANNVATQTRLGESAIEAQGQKMAQNAEDMVMRIGAMEGKISGVMNGIGNIASRLEDRFGSLSESVLMKASASAKIIAETIENAEGSATRFREISGELSGRAREISAAAGEVTKISSAMPQINSINAQAKDAAGTLAAVSDGFSKFAMQKESELAMMTDNATKAMTTVASYANRLSTDINQTIAAFREMAQETDETAKKMANLSEAVSGRANAAEALNSAGFVIEELESLSIDLLRVLDPDTMRDLWTRQSQGNKVAFAKHLDTMLTKQQVGRIRDMFDTNQTFRDNVRNFVAEFDSMILRLKVLDKSEIMLATLTSSDMGRAYVILKGVLKK